MPEPKRKNWLDTVQTGIIVAIALTAFMSYRHSGENDLPLIIYKFTIFTSGFMGLIWVWAVKKGRKEVNAGHNRRVYGLICWTTGGVIVLLLSGGLGTTFFLRSERGQQILSASMSAERLIEATKGPGADALKSAGCDPVLVSSMEQAKDVFENFQPEEAVKNLLRTGTFVMCEMGLNKAKAAALDCSATARLYGEAEPDAQPPLLVVLQQVGVNQCVGKFNTDGTPFEDRGESEMVTAFAPGVTSESQGQQAAR